MRSTAMLAKVIATHGVERIGITVRRSYVSSDETALFARSLLDLVGQRLADVDLVAVAERVGLAYFAGPRPARSHPLKR